MVDGIVLLIATGGAMALGWPVHALAHWLRHRYGG